MNRGSSLDMVISVFECSCCCKGHSCRWMMKHSVLEVNEEASYYRIYCYKLHGNDSCYHHCMEIVLWLYNLAAIFY